MQDYPTKTPQQTAALSKFFALPVAPFAAVQVTPRRFLVVEYLGGTTCDTGNPYRNASVRAMRDGDTFPWTEARAIADEYNRRWWERQHPQKGTSETVRQTTTAP